MRASGLRARLLVVVASVLLVSFGMLYLALSEVTRSTLTRDEIEALERVTDTAAPLLLNLSHDHQEMRQALRQARDEAGLAALMVLDGQGSTVAPGDGLAAGALLGTAGLDQRLARPNSGALIDAPGGRLFVFLRALPGGGYLLAARSGGGLDARLSTVLMAVLLWGAAVLLAATIMGVFLLRVVVTRPIERLVEKAADVATGSEAATLEGDGSGEFGVLRKSLHDMAARIGHDRERIEAQVGELKRINAELTRAQEQLIRTEKLASVGQLAAGMAHEIGNPIGVILGYTEMLESDSITEGHRNAAVTRIKQAIERIDGTIKDLLNYSRPAEDEGLDCALESDTKSILDLLGPQRRFKEVEVEFKNELQVGASSAIPPSRYKQVILNVFLNAADAMSGKGKLTVRLFSTPSGVAVEVTDTGPGIPEENLYRIFDPFFSTKEVGKGTGLGLFVCHTIITTYGGTIKVEGRLGKGARFTIVLPGPRKRQMS